MCALGFSGLWVSDVDIDEVEEGFLFVFLEGLQVLQALHCLFIKRAVGAIRLPDSPAIQKRAFQGFFQQKGGFTR